MFAWHAPALFQVPMLQREGRESCQVSSSRMAGTVCHPPHEHLLTVSSQTTLILALHTAVSTQAKYISQCIDEIKQELKQEAWYDVLVCSASFLIQPRTTYRGNGAVHRPSHINQQSR